MGFLSILGKIGEAAVGFIPGIGPAAKAALQLGVGAGTDILGSTLNRKAVGGAANAQKAGLAAGRADLTGLQAGLAARSQPYLQAGDDALMGLKDSLGESRPGFSFDESKVTQSPFFQDTIDNAMKALSRSAAGKFRLGSGDTQKELLKYGTGLAGQDYNNQRNFQYTAQKDAYQSLRDNATQRDQVLLSLAGLGSSNAQNLNANDTRIGESLADLATTGGDVNASEILGKQAQTSKLVNNIGDRLTDYLSLRGSSYGGGNNNSDPATDEFGLRF